MTVLEGYDSFIKSRESCCSDVTVRNYRSWLGAFFEFLRSDGHAPERMEISELQLKDLYRFLYWLRAGSGVTCRSSVRMYQVALKAMLNYLEDQVDLDIDKYVLQEAGHTDRQPLSDYEVDLIDMSLDLGTTLGLRNLCIVHLMLDAGLRSTEVCALSRQDVDLDAGMLRMRGICSWTIRVGSPLLRYLVLYSWRVAPDRETFLVNRLGKPCNEESLKKVFQGLQQKTGIGRLTPTLLQETHRRRK